MDYLWRRDRATEVTHWTQLCFNKKPLEAYKGYFPLCTQTHYVTEIERHPADMVGDCSAAESPTVSTTAVKGGRWDEAWKMRGHLVGPIGWTLDNNGHSHSPLLFLLADTLPNNLLDFRIHDLVVAGWLHSLRKWKYKQNAEDKPWKDTVLMKNNEGKTKERVWGFCDAPPQIWPFSDTHTL